MNTPESLWIRVAELYNNVRQLAVAHLTPDLQVLAHSANFTHFVERDAAVLIGAKITDFFLPLVGAEPLLELILAGGQSEYRLQKLSMHRQDGNLLFFHMVIGLVVPDKPAEGLLLILEDGTESIMLEQQMMQQRNELGLLTEQLARVNALLHEQAKTDGLTGLANRRHFNEILGQTLHATLPKQRTTGLIFLDLDGFKQVNDKCGHTAGDEFLQLMGHIIKGNLRTSDTAARFGGDEFAIILPDVTVSDMLGIAMRLQQAVVTATQLSPTLRQVVGIGASVGVAMAPHHGITAASLLHAADVALYHAKRNGKNQVGVYTPSEP